MLASESEIETRLLDIQTQIPPQTVWLISKSGHVKYLTGQLDLGEIDGPEAVLLLSKSGTPVLVKSPFLQKLNNKAIKEVIGLQNGRIFTEIKNFALEKKDGSVENEDNKNIKWQLCWDGSCPASWLLAGRAALPDWQMDSLLPSDVIWQRRITKSTHEIAQIKIASQITLQAINNAISLLKPGMTELDVVAQIYQQITSLGAEDWAFPPIVAFGTHTSLPHHKPSQTKLANEMPVLIDVGAQVGGYKSDFTRTHWFGNQPSPLFTQFANVVNEAYAAAVTTIKRPMPSAKDIDLSIRNTFTNYNLLANFIHSSGHGVGIDIHEPPSLHISQNVVINSNYVLAIEPGLYKANELGYRHEDTWLISPDKAEMLGQV